MTSQPPSLSLKPGIIINYNKFDVKGFFSFERLKFQ